MRILIVVHAFPPEAPGVWTWHHAQELARRHSVWVYAKGGDMARPAFEQWEDRDGAVTIRRVNVVHFDPFHRFDNFRVPQIDSQFLGFVDEVRPDVIHFEHLFGLSATMVRGAHARGVPIVLSLYDYWLVCQRAFLLRDNVTPCPGPGHAFDCVTCVEGPDESARSWRLPLHDFRLAVMRDAVTLADAVTACSVSLQQNLTRLMRLPEGHIRAVTLGVPPLAGPVARQGAPVVRIAYLGVVAPHKGVEVLAEAVARLDDLDLEVRLHGPVAPEIRAALAGICPRLTFEGPYTRHDLPAILGRTDVLVIPSLAAETFSIVVREAALADVAVVGSRIGAIPEYIRDEETGLLVTPGDAAGLAAALRRLATDPALRARLATTHDPIRTVPDYTAEMEAIYAGAIARRMETAR